ncbi:mandelate racemase/muconate lactonizing enzyme family protein [Sulfitobacter sp. SK011]|uniref:mandelate racemase/muconate lactonizing enzyme family protein n=1 Tax=Sulfitobacter sp. SK011 TaxID=1389004 RepID=UPI0020C7B92D|nr:mandelate racemase/muconate lactonizing enzyme family protein [Sulfitobacter sp. SK011]
MIEITRIQAWAFRSPTKKPVATSFGVMHDRPAVLVRIEDRDGAFGWGEIWANWPAAGAEHRVRLLEMDVAHLVLGVPFASPTDFFHKLDAQTRIRAVQCGEVGPFAQVIAGLDIALWDMAARREGLPLRRLIRKDAADSVPAYASGIQISAADDLMPRARADGHQRFKLKVGFDMDADIAAVHRVEADLAQNELIACDANQAWSLQQAKEFLSGIAGVPLHWLEEPLPVFNDAADWRTLADHATIPLAGGENIIGEADFDNAIKAGVLSVIQPDVAKWGGVTGNLAVARNALANSRRYFPHFLGAGIGMAASAELLAGAGGDGLLEVDVNENPLRSMLFEGGEPVSDGMWQCSDRPGLGIHDIPEGLAQFETLFAEIR